MLGWEVFLAKTTVTVETCSHTRREGPVKRMCLGVSAGGAYLSWRVRRVGEGRFEDPSFIKQLGQCTWRENKGGRDSGFGEVEFF